MFISRIKEFRLKAGLSQLELARKSNVSQTQISNIESNRKSTTLFTLTKISQALQVCIYDLTYYECGLYENCEKPEKNHLNCYNDAKHKGCSK